MANEAVVEPRAGVPAAPMAPAAAEPAPSAGLSEEVIGIPAIQAILAGSPPAVSASIKDLSARPEGKAIAANFGPLQEAGMGLYRSLAGDLGVLFNRMIISDQEIMDADKAGKLADIAPPFDNVNAEVAKAGQKNPILSAKNPTGLKQAPAPSVQPAPIAPVEAAKPATSKQVMQKNKALTPGGPTSGPAPGAGRLLNNILKPVI